jgi:hypothetical protein
VTASVNSPTQEPGPVEEPFKSDLRNTPVQEGPLFAARALMAKNHSFFFADFETDGFRAQRRLYHVGAFSLAITAESSSHA